MEKEEELLKSHITKHHLKATKERSAILKAFLDSERHVSAEALYRQMKDEGSTIGLATVYRTLNLFCSSGLAEQRRFGDGQARYELTYNVDHHDHLICKECDLIIEFENDEIEALQKKVAKENNFKVSSHRLELYGVCSECLKEKST